MREILIIKVPVNTTSKTEFLAVEGEFNNFAIEETIWSFIKKKLALLQIYPSKSIEILFGELIDNAYDAFIEKNLKIGDTLELKVVVKVQHDNSVVVKIMDNGTGFANHPKGEIFERNAIQSSAVKNHDVAFGGARAGLAFLERKLKEQHASLFFKNRKSQGASVYIAYPPAAPVPR